jgi:hypothetical protein
MRTQFLRVAKVIVLMALAWFGVFVEGVKAQDVVEQPFEVRASDVFVQSQQDFEEIQCSSTQIVASGAEVSEEVEVDSIIIEVQYIKSPIYCIVDEYFPVADESPLLETNQILDVRDLRVVKKWTDDQNVPRELKLAEVRVYIPVGYDSGIIFPSIEFGPSKQDTPQRSEYWTTNPEGQTVPSNKIHQLAHLLAATFALANDVTGLQVETNPLVPFGRILIADMESSRLALTISYEVNCPELSDSYIVLNPKSSMVNADQTLQEEGASYVYNMAHEWAHVIFHRKGLQPIAEQNSRLGLMQGFEPEESFAEFHSHWFLEQMTKDPTFENSTHALYNLDFFDGKADRTTVRKLLSDLGDYYARLWSFGNLSGSAYMYFPSIGLINDFQSTRWLKLLKNSIGECYDPRVNEVLARAGFPRTEMDDLVMQQVSLCLAKGTRVYKKEDPWWLFSLVAKMADSCKYIATPTNDQVFSLDIGQLGYFCVNAPLDKSFSYRIRPTYENKKDLFAFVTEKAEDFGPDSIVVLTIKDRIVARQETNVDMTFLPSWSGSKITCMGKTDIRPADFEFKVKDLPKLGQKLFLPLIRRR